MNSFLDKILNFGGNSEDSFWISKRIRIVNSLAIFLPIIGVFYLIFGIIIELQILILLLVILLIITCLITLFLNFHSKTIIARIFFLIVFNIVSLCFSVIAGPDFNFQYFAISILGVPFLFFKDEIGKFKLLLGVLPLLVFLFSTFYNANHEAAPIIEEHYTNILCLVNDLVIFLISFIIFYLIYKENRDYVKALNKQAALLQEKNTQLEHFAYIAAHDLNEPLNSVSGLINIIKDDYQEKHDEKLKTYFAYINSSLIGMRAMITGLLTYSRIGKFTNTEATDVSELLTEIKIDLKKVIKHRGVDILSEKLPVINCIKAEIKQLFQNLITNAIKFQKSGIKPIIQISCVDNNDHWEFCVSDNGIGIQPKNLKNIFQFFTKLHLKSEYKGHGIGLAFCKKIVEIHNGKIWVTSSEMKGSKFYFTIQKTELDEKKVK